MKKVVVGFLIILLVISMFSVSVNAKIFSQDLSENGGWVSISDNNLISNITGIKILKNGTILCIADGNIIRSVNGGKSFEETQGIDESDIRLLLVGGSQFYAMSFTSVYFSDDYGATWKFVYRINGDTITAASIWDNKLYIGTFLGKVMVSEDFGKTFKPLDGTDGMSTVNAILKTGDTIYVATNKGLFVSNGGKFTKNGTFGDNTISFVGKKGNEIYVFALLPVHHGDESYVNTVIEKSENGINFSKVYELTNQTLDSLFISNDAFYALSIGRGLMYSTSGNNWQTLDDTDKIPDVLSFAISQNGSEILIGTKAAILKSTDSGKTFKKTKERIDDLRFNCIFNKDNGEVVIGTNHGVLKRVPPESFENIGISSENVNALTTFNNELFAGTNSGVFVDANGEWKKIGINDHIYTFGKSNEYLFVGGSNGLYRIDSNMAFQTIGNDAIKGAIYSIFVKDGTILVGTSFTDGGGLFKSNDGGDTWKKIPNTPGTDITSIFVDDNNGIFIGTWVLGIFYSSDGGNTWVNKNNGLGELDITKIKYIDNMMYCGTFQGIYVSKDMGKSWKALGKNLASSRISDICLCFDKNLIVDTEDGIFEWKPYVLKANLSYTKLQVELTWSKFPESSNIAGYEIFKRVDNSSDWKNVAKLSADKTSYIDTDVTSGTKYFYFVKSFDDKDPPNYFISNVVSCIPQKDATPPNLQITSPQNYTTVNEDTIDVTGKVTDDGSGVKSVTVNGNAVTIDNNGTFSTTVSLMKGDNTITVVATDKAGNKTTKTITVTYKPQIIITLQPNNPMMTVNGVQQEIDPGRGTKPVIIPKWGRTVVPIRAIVEALGGTIGWDGKERKVTINLNDTIIELWIGKPQAEVNGIMKWIDDKNHDVKPIIVNGRTMLPLRFVAENLGCKVDWNGTTKTITITYIP